MTFAVRAPLRLDISHDDLFATLTFCAPFLRGTDPTERILRRAVDRAEGLVTLSVRSSLDLLLQARAFPPGTEVLMSAISHPDMFAIVAAHGLVPVPVDLQFHSAAPDLGSLARAHTPAARVVVVAHLFGGIIDLDATAAFCRRHGLELWEDCAEVFGADYSGHPDATAAMFSFGPLKTCSSLGGAIAIVRDRRLLERMRELQSTYPVQRRRALVKRVAQYGFLRAMSTRPKVYGAFHSVVRAAGRDPSELARQLGKSFSGPIDLGRFRERVGPATLELLDRRLERFDGAIVRKRRETVAALRALVPDLLIPGWHQRDHVHWILPICVDEPAAVLASLRARGFDALPGLSNLSTFDPPAGREDLAPVVAREILAHGLLVPLHIDVPDEELGQLAAALASHSTAAVLHALGRMGASEPGPSSVPRSTPAEKRASGSSLRVVSLNVWSGLDYAGTMRSGTHESRAARERRHAILIRELAALEPDVVALNEVNPAGAYAERIARDLGGYDVVAATGLSGLRLGAAGLPTNLREGDAILARRHLRMERAGRRRLSGGLVTEAASVNFTNATQVLAARVFVGVAPIYVFCTHWSIATDAASFSQQRNAREDEVDHLAAEERARALATHHRASQVRAKEAQRTREFIEQTVPSGVPYLLLGDLNGLPDSPELGVLCAAGLRDAFATARPGETGATWDESRNEHIRRYYVEAQRQSDVAHRVDYVLLSPDIDPTSIRDARVAFDEPGSQPSDHFGVLVDLTLPFGRSSRPTTETT